MDSGKCLITGKLMYADRRQAQTALGKLRQRRAGHKTERAYYQCRHCGSWHLTSMDEKPSIRRRLTPNKRWRWTGRIDEDTT